MTLSHRRFALMLALTPGIGGRSLRRILTRMDLLGHSPERFLQLSAEALREDYGLTAQAAQSVVQSNGDTRDELARAVDRLEESGVTMVTSVDARYPSRLEAFDPDPPALLFLYGNEKLFGARTFAVLCSNFAPPACLEKIEKLSERGVLESKVLVTGVNRIAYQRAAVVPLRWGSPRILCLDRGIFPTLGESLTNEPFPAARLWRFKFDPHTDLVISPVRPDLRFAGAANRVRDRIVCGLADELYFVHIRRGGTMERLLRMAIAAGRATRVASDCPGAEEYAELGATLDI